MNDDRSDPDIFEALGTTEIILPKGGPERPASVAEKQQPLLVVDFADLTTISQKLWIARRLLAAGEMSCWFGAPGSGKSVLAEDIGLHVATGREWQGRAVKPGAVLYVGLERAAVVARRALAFGVEHGLIGSKLPFAILPGPLDFRVEDTARKVIVTMKDLATGYGVEPRVIIIDTVSRALSGGDENSSKDMGTLIAALAIIQTALPGAHIMLIHHIPTDGKERMRGHGSLLGAVDAAFSVTNGGTLRTAECVKSSDLEDEQRIGFTLRGVVVGKDDQGGNVSAPFVVPEQASTAPPKPARAKKMPTGARVAYAALCDAVIDFGAVPSASNYIPSNVKTVTVDRWRDYAYRRGVSTSEQERARQQAFQRAVSKLQDASMVGIWGGQVWIAA